MTTRAMRLTRFDDGPGILAAAGDYLVAREAQHNLPLGILGTLRDRPEVYPEPPYLAVVMDGDPIALVAVRTPPWDLVLSEAGVPERRIPEAVDVLIGDLLTAAPDLPGVLGPPSTVGPFVARWSDRTGETASLAMAERAYRLTRVVPPEPVPGRWRFAEESDRALLVDWIEAFHREALLARDVRQDIGAMVDRFVHDPGRWTYLWEVDGRSVSLVCAGAATPNGIRIGPVYTPPGHRRTGYAGALTAAASQDQLDRGRRFCFLFTDLANKTSNHIYQAVGYEPVTDIDRYRLERPAR